MKRIPLLSGTQIKSDSLCFVIDSVIGNGANCIVYSAHYDDGFKHRKEVIIKECYPIRDSITRKQDTLLWSSTDEMQSAFDRLQRSYDLASEMQNSDLTRSASVYALDKIHANGTQYIIMIPQHGYSYDKEKNTDISDIIRTVLALCNAVSFYHKSGFLHLDIKPSNFIATTDHTGKGKNIALFDLDTLVALDDLRNASVTGVSYSKEWAAPEQKQMQISKMCPATDLFAIGAILFERIMNKMPTNADMSPFAEWEFDDRFNAKKVNPKAKRLLTEIFHKTLAANVKRRYQSADALAAILEELLDIVCGKSPYIVSSIPVNICRFVGRTEEMKQLETSLEENDSVFITGFGGIGKTELVKQYIYKNKDKYDVIVFMVYNTSIQDCLNSIVIYQNGSYCEPTVNLIKQLCDEKTLIVLDNFDVAVDDENDISLLLSLQSKVIVTTRTDFSDIYQDSEFLTLCGLPVAELYSVFEIESGLSLTESDKKTLSHIYYLGRDCTYFWTMISRLAKSGAYSVPEIVKIVHSGLEEFENTENIIDTKDGIRIKRTVAKAMTNLFKLDKFTERDYTVLEMLYYLDGLNLTKRQIKELFSFSSTISRNKLMNAFNSLLEKGYVECVQYKLQNIFRINDVLKNVLEYERKPSIDKSEIVRGVIEKHIFCDKRWIRSVDYTSTDIIDNIIYRFKCLYSIFSKINLNNKADATYFINLLYSMIGSEAESARYAVNNYIHNVLVSILKIALNTSFESMIRIKAYIILCVYSCCGAVVTLFEEFTDNNRTQMKNAETTFNKAIEIINTNHITDEKIINDLCKPIIWAFMNSKSGVCHNFFSGRLIEQVINLNPVCLRDEKVTPQKSFLIRCLLNEEYEAIYLENALRYMELLDNTDAEQYAYITIGRILLNGIFVNAIVPEYLRILRKKVFDCCKNKYIENENTSIPKLSGINPLDFAPDPLGMPLGITVGQALPRFIESLDNHNVNNELIEFDYSDELLMDEDDLEDFDTPAFFINQEGQVETVDMFIESISSDLPSSMIGGRISEFLLLVDTEFDIELPDDEKRKYFQLADLLEKCIYDHIDDSFSSYDDCDFIEKDSYYVQTQLESIKALMYAKINDTDNLYKCMANVLEHSKDYLWELHEDEIEDFEHGFNCDLCFWSVFNRIKNMSNYTGYAANLLIRYSHIVEDYFNINEELDNSEDPDYRLYNYYREIVKLANKSLKDAILSRKILSVIFEDDEDNAPNIEENIKYYKEIIDSYSEKLKQLSGQEYNP